MAFIDTVQSIVYGISITIILLLAGLGLVTLIKRFLHRLILKLKLNELIKKRGFHYDVEGSITLIVSLAVYITFIVIFLNYLKITYTLFYIFLGVVLVLILLTSIVGIKDILPNLLAMLLLRSKNKIKVGMDIKVQEICGVVQKVGYFETKFKTEDGDVLLIPNYILFKSKKNSA